MEQHASRSLRDSPTYPKFPIFLQQDWFLWSPSCFQTKSDMQVPWFPVSPLSFLSQGASTTRLRARPWPSSRELSTQQVLLLPWSLLVPICTSSCYWSAPFHSGCAQNRVEPKTCTKIEISFYFQPNNFLYVSKSKDKDCPCCMSSHYSAISFVV